MVTVMPISTNEDTEVTSTVFWRIAPTATKIQASHVGMSVAMVTGCDVIEVVSYRGCL